MSFSLTSALFAQLTGGACPAGADETIRGWGTHVDEVALLPASEQAKIAQIADLVVTSFTMTGCSPLGLLVVVGHADHDAKGAAFEQQVSEERATSVSAALATAMINLWKARKLGVFPSGAIKFEKSGVGAKEPDIINVPTVRDRKLNRRVDIKVRLRGAPLPPKDTFPTRVARFLALLATRKVDPDPSGKRTARARCILGKILLPGIIDVFVDGTASNQQVGPHRVAGNLCSFSGKYDPPTLSDADFAKFLGTVSVVLKGPGFGPTKSDADILRGLSGLILMINEGIIKVERYITVNSSDFGYVGDRTRGTRLASIFADHLQDPNSIYSCYADFTGNE